MTISLIGILLTLIVIGLVLYVIRMLPIEPFIKNIAYIVVCIFLLLWLLSLVGGVGPVITIR